MWQIEQTYLRSSLCVNLCLAMALELLKDLSQNGQRRIPRDAAEVVGRCCETVDEYVAVSSVDVDKDGDSVCGCTGAGGLDQTGAGPVRGGLEAEMGRLSVRA